MSNNSNGAVSRTRPSRAGSWWGCAATNTATYTPHHTPEPRHPTPYTLNPEPWTLNPTPYTLNPEPQPLDPELGAVEKWSRARAACRVAVRGHPTPHTFFFFFTLLTGPRRSLSLKMSDTRVYAPQIRWVPRGRVRSPSRTGSRIVRHTVSSAILGN